MADVKHVETFLTDEETARKEIEKTVSSEIAGAVGPLEGQIDRTEAAREAAAGRVGEIFGATITGAQAGAESVRESYEQGVSSEKAIISAAQERINALYQQRASDAQALAQQIGGPVPLSQFTDPATFEGSLFASESAGSLLRATGMAEAGVQHAEAYSSRILPLMRAREMVDTRAKFNDEISRIRDEITSIKKQKTGLVNERLRARMLEDREFALARATANRDWFMARETAKLERDRLKIQEEEIYGGAPGKGPTLAARGLREERETVRQSAIASRRASAFELLEAAMNPGVESVKMTQFFPAPVRNAEEAASVPGAFWNGNQWVVAKDVTVPSSQQPLTNPNALEKFLVGNNIPRDLARKVIKSRFPDWTPGKLYGEELATTGVKKPPSKFYSTQELQRMPPHRVIKIARALGFQQKVPPGIAKLARRTIPNPPGDRAGPTRDNPDFDMKKYNTKLKNFYIYWIRKIYEEQYLAGKP